MLTLSCRQRLDKFSNSKAQISTELSQFRNFISLLISFGFSLDFPERIENEIWYDAGYDLLLLLLEVTFPKEENFLILLFLLFVKFTFIYTISFNKTTKVKMSSNVMSGNSFKRTSWSLRNLRQQRNVSKHGRSTKNEHRNHLYFRVVCLLCADIRLLSSSSPLFAPFSGLNFLPSIEISASLKEKTLPLPFIPVMKKEGGEYDFSIFVRVQRHNILFNMLYWYCRSSLVITSEISPVTVAKSGLMKREHLLISVWHQIQRASPRAVHL